MAMGYENKEDQEIVLDFGKFWEIIKYRKKLFLKSFIIILLLLIVLVLILPKKYEVNADLYVNKTNNTNLAEINPYVIASLGGADNVSSLLSGGNGAGLQNEVEIMRSPLVLNNVIKDNNLRYLKGEKKGELLSTEDFLKKNISISPKRGTNVISISYKSRKPLQSYNVVNSIISNYEKVNEGINTKKAQKDKELLAKTYADTNKSVNQKLATLKTASTLPESSATNLGMLAALKGHSRAIGGAMGSIQSQIVEGKKSQLSIDQDVDKLKFVKTKLEWSNLIEKMAKDTTNVIVLKKPELKRSFDYTEPNLKVNIILSIFLAIAGALLAVLYIENMDKSLTYTVLGKNTIFNIEDNLEDLKLLLMANQNDNFSLVSFNGFSQLILQQLSSSPNLKIIPAQINPQTINEIVNSNNIILAGKVGETSKKTYQQIKCVCEDAQKPICAEIV